MTINRFQTDERAAKRAAWEAEDKAAAEAERARDARYKYLPPTYRAMDELADATNRDVADKIRALIDAVLEEARDAERGND